MWVQAHLFIVLNPSIFQLILTYFVLLLPLKNLQITVNYQKLEVGASSPLHFHVIGSSDLYLHGIRGYLNSK